MVETPIMIPAIHHFRYQPLININAHTRDWPRATAAQQFVDQCGGLDDDRQILCCYSLPHSGKQSLTSIYRPGEYALS